MPMPCDMSEMTSYLPIEGKRVSSNALVGHVAVSKIFLSAWVLLVFQYQTFACCHHNLQAVVWVEKHNDKNRLTRWNKKSVHKLQLEEFYQKTILTVSTHS